MKKFYVVWSPQGHAPTYRHDTLTGARNEAERLAQLNQGREFIVLESKGSAKHKTVFWQEHGHLDYCDEVPF